MSFKKVISINTNNNKLLSQEIIGTSIHQVQNQYRILSKNDFGIHPHRINMGVFNKKTNLKISEKESIMVFDSTNNSVITETVPNILKNTGRYFLIWKYSIHKRNIKQLELIDKNTSENFMINLTYEFAKNIIKKYSNNQDISFSKEEELFINNFINIKYNKISFNKFILVNSNYKFLLGLLTMFNSVGEIPENINIYNIGLIFNLLECSYSIRKRENTFVSRYKFSNYLYKLLILEDTVESKNILEDFKYKFRNLKYFILNNKIQTKFLKYFNKVQDIKLMMIDDTEGTGGTLINEVNSGRIELIPCTDLIFEKIKDSKELNESMIDLVMEHDDAHNFFLDGLPLLKNSDGDILAALALFSKEASKEADENFSAMNKQKFINPASLKVQNWGVKTDSQLGLYNTTK
jgi:hypothetical protein